MLYTAPYLQPGCPARHFRRNQLTPVLISLSPLAPGHANDLNISTAIGPPPRFPATSSCPGLDRLVSGLAAMTPGTFIPRPWRCCGPVGFPSVSPFKGLTSPWLLTPRPVFRNVCYDTGPLSSYCHLTVISFGENLPFNAVAGCNHLVSGSFNPLPGVLFIFPSRY